MTERVVILLGTYNGARFIREQLDSIVAQTHADWHLVVSDDGSKDGTLDIVADVFRDRPDQVTITKGPQLTGTGGLIDARQPATLNFLKLACEPTVAGDLYAWCDQDDIWRPEKLERALGWLRKVPAGEPGLYGARTELITQDGQPMGFSTLIVKPPSFRNALVQSLAGGNTMVFNARARELLAAAGTVHVVAHDWWAYLLIAGAGGHVHYDSTPSMLYRQHGSNLVGANGGLAANLTRLKMLFEGEYTTWLDTNQKALKANEHLLTPDNRQLIDTFAAARAAALPSRLSTLLRLGLYRHTWQGQAALWLAAVSGRL